MATRIQVRLQKPTIELEVKAKDASGTTDKFKVGFKRYEIDESVTKARELKAIQDDLYIYSMQDLYKEYALLGREIEQDKKLPEPVLSEEQAKNKLKSFLSNEIIYLKDVNGLAIQDENGKDKEFSVSDTRTAKPVEPLWGTPEECLSVLVDSFLESAPYRGSLISAQQKALANLEFSDGEVKN